MSVEEFVEALVEKGKEYARHQVMLRRQPLDSLLNAVAGVLHEYPDGHALKEAYQVVYQEITGEKPPPPHWYGPGGTSGGS